MGLQFNCPIPPLFYCNRLVIPNFNFVFIVVFFLEFLIPGSSTLCLHQDSLISFFFFSLWLSTQFSFDVGILSIFGHLNSNFRQMLNDNYHIVDKGYNSFPTKIPGTAYHKALSVRNVLSTIHLNSSLKRIWIWLFFFLDGYQRQGKGLIKYWVR